MDNWTQNGRRTSPDFWQHSDQLHQAYRAREPIESGLFDDNRLENRYAISLDSETSPGPRSHSAEPGTADHRALDC
ncbi:MAG: hypothetical protein FJ246_07995 [Nitrospira sp.]|nr:hypothetical protein [Nitrospira sp.]